MDLTVALDDRYTVTRDGSIWCQTPLAGKFWGRYLEIFDRVKVVARTSVSQVAPKDWLELNNKGVSFHRVPDFLGPWQCLKRYPTLRSAVRGAIPSRGAVILRVGSQIGNLMEGSLNHRGHPYALEVIGDPFAVFAPGVVDHPLRSFFRWHFSRRLRQQCSRAIGVAYVTKRALQERYPTSSLSMSISDVELPDDALLGTLTVRRRSDINPASRNSFLAAPPHASPCRIVTVGSLAQLYKGTDVLIDSIARCVGNGLDVTAVIVGDGKYRPTLMAQVERAGLSLRIQFAGRVTAGESVRQFLDSADLFVLPSLTEGLPRALVEAMARGLPCIGSAVGGIPELLDSSDLVAPGDSLKLAAKIQEVVSNPLRMESMSRRNLAVAREFCSEELEERRRIFYKHVRDCTQQWESGR